MRAAKRWGALAFGDDDKLLFLHSRLSRSSILGIHAYIYIYVYIYIHIYVCTYT